MRDINRLRMRKNLEFNVMFVLWLAGAAFGGGGPPGRQSGSAIARLFLKDEWLMKSSALVKEDGDVISTGEFTPDSWYKTAVPSTVLNALIKNGVYPDMRIGLNSFLIPDSSDEFNQEHNLTKYSYLPDKRNPWKDPYWYRTEFSLPKVSKGKHIWLNFDAINYRADVWLNGKKIADREQMVGAFQRFRLNVTDCARNGKNVLGVKIYPVDHPGTPDTQLEVFGRDRGYHKEIMKDVTEVMSIGYDCMPTVPDRNMGILQDVYIDFTGPVDVRNPFVVTDLPLPKTSPASLTVSAELVNVTASPRKGVLRGVIAEDGVNFEENVDLEPGQTKKITFSPEKYPQLVLKSPSLWWPVNYGEQNLYSLSLQFIADGQLSDEESVTFGVREITKELHELDGWYGLRLNINGKKIFCRGGYIQPEILFDWDKNRIETEVRYFTKANLNLVYFEDIPNPPDEFLDACDRYGLMFGNCFYGCYWMQPNSGYPEDLDLLERCTIDIIKRYRNHPSIWLYMAMNEGDTREDVYEMWRRHIIKLDGTRLWIPSGTFPDERKNVPEWFKKDLPAGMTDWGATYTWKEPSDYFRFIRNDRKWMFMIESGSASLPPVNSLARFIPDLEKPSGNAPYPLDKTWAHHGANHYYKDYDQAIRRLYGEPQSAADYCYKGHLVTADQHRAMFEAVNHRMWDITSGFTQWKINACWPSVQWQIFDWYLKPMVSYYYIKRACEPLHIQLGLLEPTVTVVNNNLEPRKSLQVHARMYDFDMKLRLEQNSKTDIEANTYKEIFTIGGNAHNKIFAAEGIPILNLTDVFFIKLELKDSGGKLLSDNFYWFSAGSDFAALSKLPLVKLNVSYQVESQGAESIVHVKVENPTAKLAFFIHLAVVKGPNGEEILPVFWDDNYFSLLPGESKRVSARFAAMDLGKTTPFVKVGGWNIESDFECTKIEVPTTQLKADQMFTVTATIATTFIDGSIVTLFVDDKAVDSKLVWVQAGKSQKVDFTLRCKPGRHELRVGDKTTSIYVD